MPFGCLFHPWMFSEVNLEIFVKVEKKDCSAKMKAILISSKYLQSLFCHVAYFPRKQHLVILQLKENIPACTFWGFPSHILSLLETEIWLLLHRRTRTNKWYNHCFSQSCRYTLHVHLYIKDFINKPKAHFIPYNIKQMM